MTKIEGIVASSGGVSGTDNYSKWWLTFALDPWREVGGDWRKGDELRVMAPAPSHDVARRQAAALRAGEILRLAIKKIVPRSRYRTRYAVGRGPVRRIRGDAAARALVAQRARPHTIRDRVFGTLQLERAFDWVSTWRKIDGVSSELAIKIRDADDAEGIAADVVKGRPVLVRTLKQLPSIRGAVARKLLGLYNGTWREGRPKLSRAAFLERISLSSIIVAPERVTIHFEADEMFTDHGIEVRLGPRGAVSHVDLA
jgi:hypothetical protein